MDIHVLLLARLAELEGEHAAYKAFQVPVRRIEELTRVSFGRLADADPILQQEADVGPKTIDSDGAVTLA